MRKLAPLALALAFAVPTLSHAASTKASKPAKPAASSGRATSKAAASKVATKLAKKDAKKDDAKPAKLALKPATKTATKMKIAAKPTQAPKDEAAQTATATAAPAQADATAAAAPAEGDTAMAAAAPAEGDTAVAAAAPAQDDTTATAAAPVQDNASTAATAQPTQDDATASAAAAPSTKARTPLSDDQRADIATALVRNKLKKWEKATPNVRPALIGFNGDASNPITGRGPIEIYVEKDPNAKLGAFGKMRASLSPSSKQKYLVHVGDDRSAAILSEQSLAPMNRVGRFVADKLAAGEIIKDVMNSDKVDAMAGWTAASLAANLAPGLGHVVSLGMFAKVGTVIKDAVKTQNDVRTQAMTQTVAWAKQQHDDKGEWPSLTTTYENYKLTLKAAGSRPLSLAEFADELRGNGL